MSNNNDFINLLTIIFLRPLTKIESQIFLNVSNDTFTKALFFQLEQPVNLLFKCSLCYLETIETMNSVSYVNSDW